MNGHILLLKKINLLYPHSQTSEDTIVMMADFLKDIPITELAIVLRELVRESRFMPLVADIVSKHKSMYTLNEPVDVEAAWES